MPFEREETRYMAFAIVSYENSSSSNDDHGLPGMPCFRPGRYIMKQVKSPAKYKNQGVRSTAFLMDAKGRDLNARIRNWPLFYEICNVVVLNRLFQVEVDMESGMCEGTLIACAYMCFLISKGRVD